MVPGRPRSPPNGLCRRPMLGRHSDQRPRPRHLRQLIERVVVDDSRRYAGQVQGKLRNLGPDPHTPHRLANQDLAHCTVLRCVCKEDAERHAPSLRVLLVDENDADAALESRAHATRRLLIRVQKGVFVQVQEQVEPGPRRRPVHALPVCRRCHLKGGWLRQLRWLGRLRQLGQLRQLGELGRGCERVSSRAVAAVVAMTAADHGGGVQEDRRQLARHVHPLGENPRGGGLELAQDL
eukprot:scaffold13341_cov101-Isochrysis_galbana.AAC.5